MHEVQARRRLLAPLTRARTLCRFTFQRRLVTLWAWLTLCPNCGPLPHISQTLAINCNAITAVAPLVCEQAPQEQTRIARSQRMRRRFPPPTEQISRQDNDGD